MAKASVRFFSEGAATPSLRGRDLASPALDDAYYRARAITLGHARSWFMSQNSSALDPAFIERQRASLIQLRNALRAAAQSDEDEEAGIQQESAGDPREYEDDAQKLANLELAGNRVVRDARRLSQVERSLEKLKEGSYGLSDLSGKPIPRERLEAVPEAICTFEEQEQAERSGR